MLRTGRAIEAELLSEVTGRLRRYGQDFPKAAAAVNDNRRIWSVLAADVGADGNELPQALRAQLFYLAEFTHFHSDRFLRNEAGLEALIDINTAVIRGLNAQGAS
ncbi:flagellar biosynthesis regulator FlhF [Loktanella sp. 3ANDIMAR09]|nr:flagellar biosynthesis regulator FlhF [Loktanella sp. 3ANDIMAR09]